MFLKKIILAHFLFSLMSCAMASNLKSFRIGALYEGDNLAAKTLSQVAGEVMPGTVVVISEYHAQVKPKKYNEHQKKQFMFLAELKKLNPKTKINVGMEFINYTYNNDINSYLQNKMTDDEFRKAIKWTADFASYKPLIQFPKSTGGTTLGINLPRTISSAIAKKGVSGLSPKEQAMLPPNFQVGRAEYKDRFTKLMGGGHLPPHKIDRYFAAQSSWDDTMAYQTVEYMKSRPDEIFVIIVGDFHNIYGGGLPDRLKARGAQMVFTVSQESAKQMNDKELKQAIHHDSNGEKRADYIWISK